MQGLTFCQTIYRLQFQEAGQPECALSPHTLWGLEDARTLQTCTSITRDSLIMVVWLVSKREVVLHLAKGMEWAFYFQVYGQNSLIRNAQSSMYLPLYYHYKCVREEWTGTIRAWLFSAGKASQHGWFSGRILACHAGGPGSIPGPCKDKCFLN